MDRKSSVVVGRQMIATSYTGDHEIWINTVEKSPEYHFIVYVRRMRRIDPLKVSISSQATLDEWHSVVSEILRNIAILSGKIPQEGCFSLELTKDCQSLQIVDSGEVISTHAVPTNLVDWRLLIESLGNRILAA